LLNLRRFRAEHNKIRDAMRQASSNSTHRLRGMTQSRRLTVILERLAQEGGVTVAGIARELGVSAATVRRDLILLESQHMLSRTHGGAIADGVLFELPLRYRGARQVQEKRRLAHEAAARVIDGEAIGLTGGTTMTEVARALIDRPRLTVVTNALNIAAEIAVRPNLKLFVTGGVARAESYELVGPIAQDSLRTLNLSVAFIGVDGISSKAHLTTHHDIEAGTDRALIDRAERVIVVADSSKVGKAALAQICPLSAVDELITDERADPSEVAALRESGLAVTIV
jgi:DeoR family transcriptional regulator of aga operon